MIRLTPALALGYRGPHAQLIEDRRNWAIGFYNRSGRWKRGQKKKRRSKSGENWLRLIYLWLELVRVDQVDVSSAGTDRFGFAPALYVCVLVDHHLRRPALFLGGYVRQGPKEREPTQTIIQPPSIFFFCCVGEEEEEEKKGSDNEHTQTEKRCATRAPFIFDNENIHLERRRRKKSRPIYMCRGINAGSSANRHISNANVSIFISPLKEVWSFHIFIADIRSPPCAQHLSSFSRSVLSTPAAKISLPIS